MSSHRDLHKHIRVAVIAQTIILFLLIVFALWGHQADIIERIDKLDKKQTRHWKAVEYRMDKLEREKGNE